MLDNLEKIRKNRQLLLESKKILHPREQILEAGFYSTGILKSKIWSSSLQKNEVAWRVNGGWFEIFVDEIALSEEIKS